MGMFDAHRKFQIDIFKDFKAHHNLTRFVNHVWRVCLEHCDGVAIPEKTDKAMHDTLDWLHNHPLAREVEVKEQKTALLIAIYEDMKELGF